MNVDLPDTGCNIIINSSSFYNYSQDRHTRETWVIYDGKALLQSSNTSQYGYDYSGTCLVDGDLIYKPEYKELIMPNLAIAVFMFICIFIFRLLRGRR